MKIRKPKPKIRELKPKGQVSEMDKEQRVWVVNAAGHDYSQAEKFGKLQAITKDKVNIFNVQRCASEMGHTMRAYNKRDWLLLSGHIVLNCIAVSIIMEKHGSVNLLLYDNNKRKYVPRDVSKKQIRGETMEDFNG